MDEGVQVHNAAETIETFMDPIDVWFNLCLAKLRPPNYTMLNTCCIGDVNPFLASNLSISPCT
jgi:hypothetical protein